MSPLSFHDFALGQKGFVANLALTQGESMAVMGPAASGKSRLLSVCVGEETAPRGSVKAAGEIAIASLPPGRRLRPQTIAQREKGASRAARATEALTATGLWDARQTPLAELTPSQLAACELLAPLAGTASLIVIDGQLDQLDPWALAGVLGLLRKRMADGACVVVVTHRLDLLPEFDWVVLLKACEVRFAGRVGDIQGRRRETVVVETSNQSAVKALGQPFEINAEETPEGLVLTAAPGQQLAAKLLLEGYGDIRSILIKDSGASEALMRLIDGR